MQIKVYNSDDQKAWDQFITNSSNGHFIFYRHFMEYHSTRFSDYSMMIYDKNKLIALIPANISNNTVYSHQGLTYGGVIINKKSDSVIISEVLTATIKHLQSNNIDDFFVKCPPAYTYEQPNSNIEYALFQKDALLISRDLGAVINLREDRKYSKGRKHNISKAKKANLSCNINSAIDEFYPILKLALSKHGTKPVHTLDELTLLQKRFPDNIKCHTVKDSDNKTIAGCILFDWKHFTHSQYLASSLLGQSSGALDYLLDILITQALDSKKYFSFGVSTTNNGKELNHGLLMQKQGFGASSQLQDCYQLNLKDK